MDHSPKFFHKIFISSFYINFFISLISKIVIGAKFSEQSYLTVQGYFKYALVISLSIFNNFSNNLIKSLLGLAWDAIDLMYLIFLSIFDWSNLHNKYVAVAIDRDTPHQQCITIGDSLDQVSENFFIEFIYSFTIFFFLII